MNRSETSKVRQRMTQNFVLLDPGSTLAEANAILRVDLETLGVVLDDAARPVTLVNVDTLSQVDSDPTATLREAYSQLPPGLVLSAEANIADFVEAPAYAALNQGALGALVFEDNQLVGVLSVNTLDSYIVDEYEPRGESRGSLVELAGDIITKPLIIYCKDYKHRNELEYFNPDDPPECQVKRPVPHLVR